MLFSTLVVISFIHVHFFGIFIFSTKSQQISVGTGIWSTYKGVQNDWLISTNLENIYISFQLKSIEFHENPLCLGVTNCIGISVGRHLA